VTARKYTWAGSTWVGSGRVAACEQQQVTCGDAGVGVWSDGGGLGQQGQDSTGVAEAAGTAASVQHHPGGSASNSATDMASHRTNEEYIKRLIPLGGIKPHFYCTAFAGRVKPWAARMTGFPQPEVVSSSPELVGTGPSGTWNRSGSDTASLW
jgi:hypothetical protein